MNSTGQLVRAVYCDSSSAEVVGRLASRGPANGLLIIARCHGWSVASAEPGRARDVSGPVRSTLVMVAGANALLLVATATTLIILALVGAAALPRLRARLARARDEGAMAEGALVRLALTRDTDALWDWDLQSDRTARGSALWNQLGYDALHLDDQTSTWTALIHPADRALVQHSLQAHLDGRTLNYAADYRMLALDGSWHEISDHGRVVQRSSSATPLRMIGLATDVSRCRRQERTDMEEEALTSLGRLTAQMAHEINNPLAGIRNAFLLVKDGIPLSHPHYRFVHAIEREIERIAVITRRLSETYRPPVESAGRTSPRVIVEDAAAALMQINRARRVRIDTELDDAPAIIEVSEAVFRMCVHHLTQHVIDNGPLDDVLTVHVRSSADGVQLRVRTRQSPHDEAMGPAGTVSADGVPEDDRPGLGLALVRRTVPAGPIASSCGD